MVVNQEFVEMKTSMFAASYSDRDDVDGNLTNIRGHNQEKVT